MIKLIITVIFFMEIGHAGDYDTDLMTLRDYFGEQENKTPRTREYKQASALCTSAQKKWVKRAQAAEASQGFYRTPISESYTQEDKEAIAQGKDYCKEHKEYWNERVERLREFQEDFNFYRFVLEAIDPDNKFVSTIASSSSTIATNEVDRTFQAGPSSLPDKTAMAAFLLNQQIETLSASFFRSLKQETSKDLTSKGSYGLGYLWAATASASRKVGRVCNGKGLTDQGAHYPEQKETFLRFMSAIKNDQNCRQLGIESWQWLVAYIRNPHLYSGTYKHKPTDYLVNLILATQS
ncbi:hypothetical protein [Candidatus Paracaedibacter symbiosus]|uniref:hypothetical protein n=1 Tax=Candidatus Paracaedibacter symbiosus TaxID=244582 RepID=UPI0012EBA883|nr:hypothetical protein [Candidatus Paracaedibacter symbiosus]